MVSGTSGDSYSRSGGIRAVNPIRLLREMLKAKKTNYASVPVYLTTFYREGVRYKQKFRNLTEAVLKSTNLLLC